MHAHDRSNGVSLWRRPCSLLSDDDHETCQASASQRQVDSLYESQYRLMYSDQIYYGNTLEERLSRDQSRPHPKGRGQQRLTNFWTLCIRPQDLTYNDSVILQRIPATSNTAK